MFLLFQFSDLCVCVEPSVCIVHLVHTEFMPLSASVVVKTMNQSLALISSSFAWRLTRINISFETVFLFLFTRFPCNSAQQHISFLSNMQCSLFTRPFFSGHCWAEMRDNSCHNVTPSFVLLIFIRPKAHNGADWRSERMMVRSIGVGRLAVNSICDWKQSTFCTSA